MGHVNAYRSPNYQICIITLCFKRWSIEASKKISKVSYIHVLTIALAWMGLENVYHGPHENQDNMANGNKNQDNRRTGMTGYPISFKIYLILASRNNH